MRKLKHPWVKTVVDYQKHLKINIKAALKCFILIFFHLAHGILPIKLTEHKYWGIG